MKKISLFTLIAFFIIVSCSKSSDGGGNGGGGSTNCSGVPSSFSANVNPIIQSTCTINTGCHGSGSPNGPGELLTYTQIFNARVAIKTSVGNGTMPKTGTLTTAQKNSIICWVDSGAPNN
jgi:hypothetical protein